MLSLLHIENIAVIEQAEIRFGHGFHVLTGETGAGKSIIIDAISAILGERTYREVIRTGTDKAFVSAIFNEVPPLDWFEQYHVPVQDELLIQREIFLDGRNVCRVNGQSVTVSALRDLGSKLISIHGQHDSRQLFDENSHLGILDAFAGDRKLLDQYAAAWEDVRTCRATLDRLSIDEGEKARRQEMLQHQIKELEKADLKPGEDERLEARQKVLMNGEKLMDSLTDASRCLLGDDDTDGADTLLSEAIRELSAASRYDDAIQPLRMKFEELSYQLSDACEELRDYRDGLSDAEEELDEIGARLDIIHKLKRKYGETCEQMLVFLDNARAELDDIVFADEKIKLAEKALAAAVASATELAEQLHTIRLTAARRLEDRITTELSELNMPRVQFVCQFEEVPLGPNGLDGLRFLMSANVGENLKPLSKVASGGELARIMLAIKNVMADQDAVSTLVFDEVDSGVSGRAAQRVAEKLLKVSEGRQVLCVTHLPQIAALAEHHLLISKSVHNDRTFTQVDALSREGRISEIARMISGAEITDNTLRSAAEMLSQNGSKY
ncbi:MAG: DNA repair protein RecN [Lachnospiraceae bacterium]|nr:DNA repair protein RecN [Lachnospiraceae bacterium]